MFRRHVLAALAVGIAADQEDAARAAIRRIDPVARGFARRRMERALIDAALACDAAQLARPPAAHVMRVAALGVAKRRTDAGDPAGTAAVYASLQPRAMPRAPIWTIATAAVVAALIGSAVVYAITRPGPPSRTYVRAMPPASATAFEIGGVPLRDASIDALLRDELTTLVVEGARTSDPAPLVARLRGARAIATRGPALAAAWDGLLDGFARGVAVIGRGGPTSRDRDELREAVRSLTDQFGAAGLGYFLEGRYRSGYPYIQAYRIVEVVFVVAAGTPLRVLSLRRLDRLNTSYAALGMHDEDVGDPVLHLERIDDNVASTVLPVLAAGAPYPIAEHDWAVSPTGKALGALIGETVRGEYARALASDAGVAGTIAAILIKRDEIIDEWRDHLQRKNIYFQRTESLFLPPNLLDQLSDVTPSYQRDKVRELENQLAALEAPRIHARVHDLVAATVRRHEAQHAFDYARDAELQYPAALAGLLGAQHDDEGQERPIVRSARAELSAYLSQIINDPVTPQAALWHLGRQVFHRDRWGTGECYVANLMIEGLARHLGAAVEARALAHDIDRERLAGLATLLARQPPDQLRTAASALWTELFGEPPTTIVDRR